MTLKHDQSKPRASLLPKGAVNAAIRVLEKTFRSKPDDKTAMVIKIVEDPVFKPEENPSSQHGSFKDTLKRLFK